MGDTVWAGSDLAPPVERVHLWSQRRGNGVAGTNGCLYFHSELKGSVDIFRKHLPLAAQFPCECIKREHFLYIKITSPFCYFLLRISLWLEK